MGRVREQDDDGKNERGATTRGRARLLTGKIWIGLLTSWIQMRV